VATDSRSDPSSTRTTTSTIAIGTTRTFDGSSLDLGNEIESLGSVFDRLVDERFDTVARRAELEYWVAPDERGTGYATELAAFGVRYAFEERGLRKVSARALEWSASRSVLEKVGVQREGRLWDHYYVEGERIDADLYGLPNTER